MTYQASGTFDVKLTQQPATSDWGLGRLTIDKQFHGDLLATSAGEMLSAMTGVAGSAAYVALERVSGSLHGRRGAFTLQHTGVMKRGEGPVSYTHLDVYKRQTGSWSATPAAPARPPAWPRSLARRWPRAAWRWTCGRCTT